MKARPIKRLRHRAGDRSRGFTLLELLVAMFIAAIIFAMGYGAINQAVKNRSGLQEQQTRLLELQTGMRILEQDFVQLAPRPIRETIGSTGTYQPALLATATSSTGASSSSAQPVVSLTRAGWTNPSGLQRPALQRVAYYFEKGTLRREYWTVLDPTQASQAVRRDILTHLKSVSLRYLPTGGTVTQSGNSTGNSNNISDSGNWSLVWPPATHTQGLHTDRLRPIAVEITLDTEDWGKIVRIIEVAG